MHSYSRFYIYLSHTYFQSNISRARILWTYIRKFWDIREFTGLIKVFQHWKIIINQHFYYLRLFDLLYFFATIYWVYKGLTPIRTDLPHWYMKKNNVKNRPFFAYQGKSKIVHFSLFLRFPPGFSLFYEHYFFKNPWNGII